MANVGRALAWTAGILAVGWLVARATVIDVWTVPDDRVLGASLAPTLGAGDTVFVLKHDVGSFGALVRCPDPEDASRFVIGRVVGTPHDKVETQGPSLVVNGHRYEGETACVPPILTIENPNNGDPLEIQCDMVNMGGGWHYRGQRRGIQETLTTRVVPGGSYFILSDGRDMHDDSRNFGSIPIEGCRHIVFRLWSKQGWGDGEHRLSYIR